jgi:hypothetical protein
VSIPPGDERLMVNQGEVTIMTSSTPQSISRRTLACAVAVLGAALLVHGCATPGVDTMSIHPPVTIDVVPKGEGCPAHWTCWSQDENWTVRLSEEPINLEKEVTPITLRWLLAGSEWEFDKKGIDFKNNSQWNPQEDPSSSTQWTATSKKKDGQIYKYMINLRKKSDSATKLNWDPTVMN